jgi:flagellar assembly factor FliW
MGTDAAGDRITIQTPRGDRVVDRSEIIHFPEGIIGFEEYTDFAILDIRDCDPFKSMLSVREGGPDFVVIEPMLVFEDYAPFMAGLPPGILNRGETMDDLVLLTIVNLSDRPENITVNLRGPILLNIRTRHARQVVIPDNRLRTKVPLLVCG